MGKAEEAKKHFEDGFLCAPAVFSTYCEQLGLERKMALRIACGFGAGIGRTGKTCGAITGALMVVGLKYGKVDLGDEESQQKTLAFAHDFINRFKSLNGSTECRELIGYDLSNPDELKLARESGVFKTKCPSFVYESAHILEGLLHLK